ncbi:MAG: glycosyltransferase family 4 protein [Vicinamibacteria bacterium]|nr:glycosyltransferase family 4 protein [Vicinamibacteria bacterium]
MRLAFVVQRYGLEIAGGAEYHCRLIAEHLARHARVEVLTTCAKDYIRWANEYAEGIETINGVTVRRFKVKRTRDPEKFAAWSRRVFDESHAPGDELRWLEAEGPFSPRLIRFLQRHAESYDHIVFFSYRYYTTYHGVLAAPHKAMLVPTAEDDGVYRLSIFPPLFRRPRAIVYNSPEERDMIVKSAQNEHVLGDVVGVGSALPAQYDPARFRDRFGVKDHFALYVGRIDRNKGCPQMLDYFLRFRRDRGSQLRLVLIGQAIVGIPENEAVLPLGFLADQDKWDALAAADLLIMPSALESLSIVTLEAWWAERPVLANAKCAVLRGQCLRSNAGLYYSNYDEFSEALTLLDQNPELRHALGRNGRAYYDRHYSWEVIEEKYLRLFSIIARQSAAQNPPATRPPESARA